MKCLYSSTCVLLVNTGIHLPQYWPLNGSPALAFILRGVAVLTTQRPGNGAPAADSRTHPILFTAAQSLRITILGRSLCDALPSRRFSGWQLNKNCQRFLLPSCNKGCRKRRMYLPSVSSPTRHSLLTRHSKYLPSASSNSKGCQRRHS